MHITALGEILIDYTPMPRSAAGMQVFEQNPGGAPANVLACAVKLGRETAFIGKVGCDMQGEFLRQTVVDAGIEARGLISDPEAFTTLAFVSLSDTGERSFAFARKPGADTRLRADELDTSLLTDTAVLHIGSLSLTDEPARGATHQAIEIAKNAGAIISYDPNYRALLWASREAAMEQMRSVLDRVDIIKISDEETALLTDAEAPEAAAAKLLEQGIPVVMVTLGADGALVATREGMQRVPGFKSDAVDTTGAGDSFWGGVLTCLTESGKRPEELTLEEAVGFARFGNAVAALCVRKRGAIPAMPTREQVMELLG
ncbi:MAG: carbohydrate kinase [Butyricicoccus sp.]|nr:carbohydrate kinase [Butyricicoccus sp.]